MRGEIEIWENNKLLHKEDNLLVNGAGELLADIMTLSPSLSGISDHATSSILDTSNYVIQAISFGKDASAYYHNAHAYPANRNLWYNATCSAINIGNFATSFPDDFIVTSVPSIANPPGFENLPSSIAHVTSFIDPSVSSNVNCSMTLDLNSAVDGEWESGEAVSGLQDSWVCASFYLKSPVIGFPPYEDMLDFTPPIIKTEFKATITSDDYSSGDKGRARNSVILGWDSTTNWSTISSVHPTASGTDDSRTVYDGFVQNNWQANGGVADVGNGWYRVWNSVPCPSGVQTLKFEYFPMGFDNGTTTGETSGGIYTFGHQLELGKWPTPLQFNSGFKPTLWDLSGSVLNTKYGVQNIPFELGVRGIKDKGTVRVLTDPLAIPLSGTYDPTVFLSSPPNPESVRVEDRATNADLSGVFSGIDVGQNLNMIPYRDTSGLGTVLRYPAAFSSYHSLSSVGGVSYVKNSLIPKVTNVLGYGLDSSTLSGIGTLGNDAYIFGCYPEGSSTGGSDWRLVSALDSSTAYHNPVLSGTYSGTFNSASSMDTFGYVTMIMSGSPETTAGYAMSSLASGLCVSGSAESFPEEGIVEYSVLFGSGDRGYSNLYGGIYNMGLWTIDLDKSLKAGNSPPYSFDPLNNPRKYRLFATKHLTIPLTIIQDNVAGGAPAWPLNAGALNYKDLIIKWRLHFL